MTSPTPDQTGADRADTDMPDALRWQLRALQQPRAPERDLWPDIAARLATAPQQAASRQAGHAPAWRRWRVPAALAAGVLVAWGAFGLIGPESASRPAPGSGAAPMPVATAPSSEPTLVQVEAAGLTRQYQAAVAEVAAVPVSPALMPAIDELDRSAALILDALERDPDSRLLLDQLRRTYTHRLALAQRMT